MRRARAATHETGRPRDHGRVNSDNFNVRYDRPTTPTEDPMIGRSARRLGTLAATVLFSLAVSLGPVLAAGDPDPRTSPEPKGSGPKAGNQSKQKSGQKKKKNHGTELQQFIDGYRAARALVLDGKYEEGIAAFKALDRDDSAEVANYIGYANRKMGKYDLAKVWYEKALALDPNHVRTWQYYGMWHVEQGNMLKAADFLEKIRLICGGTGCQEFQDLKGAMEGTVVY
jgi:tetratricopeptide (TPR) repeat protein